MAKNQTSYVASQVLEADEDAFLALKNFSNYQPANPAYTLALLTNKYAAMRLAKEANLNAQNALDAARDALVSAEWDFHNAMLGLKDQVVAQYGPDSDEVAALGLKKKSDHKPRSRKTPPA